MMGKSHFAIGVATGTAIVLYAVGTNNAVLALGMLTAPAAAMLPDIDHPRSKLGRTRIVVMGKLKIGSTVAAAVALVIYLVVSYCKGVIVGAVISLLAVVVPVAVVLLVANSNAVKEKTVFLTKHRGIMHTLIVPISFAVGIVVVPNIFVKALLVGGCLGYVSHLVADCCTTDGTPLLYPFTKKSVHLLRIRTNTKWETIVAGLLMGGIVWIGFWLGHC